MLILTNFDGFATTYPAMSRLLQKFRFPKEVKLHSLQKQQGLELSFSKFLIAAFVELFDKNFSSAI